MSTALFDGYTRYSEPRLREFGVPGAQARFLADTGLPTWCAPHMHFGEVGECWTLLPHIENATASYLGFGEDQADRAVAMCLKRFSVWVPGEPGVPGVPEVYVAGDVFLLSQALHHFQVCINRAVEVDSMVFREFRITAAPMAPFVAWLSQQDADALATGAFWHAELKRLMAAREFTNLLQVYSP